MKEERKYYVTAHVGRIDYDDIFHEDDVKVIFCKERDSGNPDFEFDDNINVQVSLTHSEAVEIINAAMSDGRYKNISVDTRISFSECKAYLGKISLCRHDGVQIAYASYCLSRLSAEIMADFDCPF